MKIIFLFFVSLTILFSCKKEEKIAFKIPIGYQFNSSQEFYKFEDSIINIYDSITTLKRFGFLVCQGADTARKDFLAMQKLIHPQPIALLKQGLQMLEQLNLVEMYENYQGRQLHVFAEYDALVPYQVMQKTKDLAANNSSIVSVEGASHGFPCFMVEQTVQIIEDFIQ